MNVDRDDICDLLLQGGLITNEIYDKAAAYRLVNTGDMLFFLIACRYITERDLVFFLNKRLRIPVISLTDYQISHEVVEAVPIDIIKKYLLMPLDIMNDIITVVMPNPLDSEAIEAVENATGRKVMLLVGLFSEILKAIEFYYGVKIEDPAMKGPDGPPLSIDTEAYRGLERRRSLRLETDLEIDISEYESDKKARIRNASLNGFLIESSIPLEMGKLLAVHIALPNSYLSYPISAVVQVVRYVKLEEGKFLIAVKMISMRLEDFKTIASYIQEQKIIKRPGPLKAQQ